MMGHTLITSDHSYQLCLHGMTTWSVTSRCFIRIMDPSPLGLLYSVVTHHGPWYYIHT
uniref:Uncharacterized protein n=1 Tax=Arundo donax TaxID=35708 RepID=A0A0A9HTY7_ARUDO